VTSNVTSSGDTYTIVLTTVATAAAGNYPLTITASGSGVSNATATYTLTLTAPPAASYTLAVTPATLSVQQGANGQATVNITRVNFTGAVGLAVTGAPAGVTTTLGASSVTGDNTTLAVAVATTVATGNYTLTVTGSATGQTDRTATLALTVTAAPTTGSIALTAAPTTLNATAGGAGVTTTVTIARTNFAGDVTLAAAPLPTGATAAFAPATTTGTTSTLTLTFGAGVAAGTYPITITGTGTGIASASTQVSVTVTAAATGSISITAGTNTIQQGASGSINVFVTRTNFTGAVTLAATGMPAGVTTTYTQPGTGNSGQVTFAVGTATAAGVYPITVTASGAGIANAVATGTLTVAGASSGGNVTMNFCAPNVPIWFAAQNGSGAWTQVTSGANNSYTFGITSTGAVAWVEQDAADDFNLNIVYGSALELGQRGTCGVLTPSSRTVTGTVAGFGSSLASFVTVSFGSAGPTTSPTAAAPNFTINNVPAGALDLLASRASFSLATQSITVDKLFLRRGLNPPNGGSLGTIDFNGADAFDPDTKNVTVGGVAAGELVGATTLFSTATGSSILLGSGTGGTTAQTTFSAFPSARTIAGDLHIVSASASQVSANIPVATRTVTTMARDPNNLNVTLGQALSAPTVSSTNGSYARVRLAVARQSDYPNLWTAGFGQSAGSTSRSLSFTVFPSVAGPSTVIMEVPDFSAVAGWQNIWGPRVGTQGQWFASANGWVIGNGNQSEGTVIRTGQRFGNFTP
jgi:hypothetical protein